MTIGISKERLMVIRENLRADNSDGYADGALALADALLVGVKELDPWRPIDENTPKDRKILVYNPVTGCYITRFTDGQWPLFGWIKDDDEVSVHYPQPTHWKELPESPKTEE